MNYNDPTHTLVSFDLLDNKQRVIGCMVARWTTDDGRFGVRFWATRNGKEYGAVQQGQVYATAEARELRIAQRLASTRKRNARQFGSKSDST